MDRPRLLEARTELVAGLRASEDWQPSYKANPGMFRNLTRLEAQLETDVAEYLYALASRVPNYVDWSRMPAPVKASADAIGNISDEVWRVEAKLLTAAVTDSITELIATGGKAGELTYGINIGISTLMEEVMRAAREEVATMVSQVTDTTRNLIRESISQSIDRGEDVTQSIERLQGVVNNPVRAELIARTESVNSYQTGLATFAKKTGAVSKTWECLEDACTICEPLNGLTVPINDKFIGSNGEAVDQPAVHPRCRCGMIYNYE